MLTALNSIIAIQANPQQISLPGFQTGQDYFISYFPTRMNTTVAPPDGFEDDQTGTVTLNLYPELFHCNPDGSLDTLFSDYAFIIATSLIKSLPTTGKPDAPVAAKGWDFNMYPNPTRDILYLSLPDDAPRNIFLIDMTGRQVQAWNGIVGPKKRLSIGQLAKGTYFVRISDANFAKTKKLMIH